eukprot:Awhi_evm1s9182
MAKEESVEHFLLESPLYYEISEQIMYSSDGFQKEWFDGMLLHRCITLLRDCGAFVSRPLITMEMAKVLVIFSILVCSQHDIGVTIFHRSFTTSHKS